MRPMNIKVLLPAQIFLDQSDVQRMVVDTQQGSLGLLPQRLDCIALLVPGLLIYETSTSGPCYLAVDAGVLVKSGPEVRISVRRAFSGTDLTQLREKIEQDYAQLDDTERSVRAVSAKLEIGFLRRLGALHHE